MEKEEFEKQWEEELVSRIDGMEEHQGQIKPMTKKDYIIMAVMVIICLGALVAGVYLAS